MHICLFYLGIAFKGLYSIDTTGQLFFFEVEVYAVLRVHGGESDTHNGGCRKS